MAVAQGYDFTALANEINITPEALLRLRRARNRFVDLETLQALCTALGCTPNDLLTEQPSVVY